MFSFRFDEDPDGLSETDHLRSAGEILLNCARETVPHPWVRQNVLRFRGIDLNFLPQMRDEYSQIVGLIAIVRTPNRLEQFPMGDGLSRL